MEKTLYKKKRIAKFLESKDYPRCNLDAYDICSLLQDQFNGPERRLNTAQCALQELNFSFEIGTGRGGENDILLQNDLIGTRI